MIVPSKTSSQSAGTIASFVVHLVNAISFSALAISSSLFPISHETAAANRKAGWLPKVMPTSLLPLLTNSSRWRGRILAATRSLPISISLW